MKSLPPIGYGLRATLIIMITTSYCAILTHFAWEPERFSWDALYFTAGIGMFPVYSFVRVLLGQREGNVAYMIISVLKLLLGKNERAEGLTITERKSRKKLKQIPDDAPSSPSTLDDPSTEPNPGRGNSRKRLH